MKFLIYILFSIFFFVGVSRAEDICTQAIKFGRLVPNVTSDRVYLTHYVGTQTITHSLTNAHVSIPTAPQFDQSKPIVIFVHGYIPGNVFPPDSSTANAIKSTNTANVYLLDYTAFSSTLNYPQAVVNAKKIGQILGKSLSQMKDRGVVGFTLIGNSLGAHLCGYAGKEYKLYKPDMIDRISAIEPAGPCFRNEVASQRLDSTDAKFVDALHTDNDLGMLRAIGHADFYPNGGNNMPGLNIDHLISMDYYKESIINNNFLTVKCNDWQTFLNGACKQNPRVPMGFWTPSTARGSFYCKTKDASPYALGEAGIV